MSTPFTLGGSLDLPGAPGLPAQPLPFGLTNQYDSKAEFEFNLPSGSGTQVVNFGSMPAAGAKAVLVQYESKAGAPVVLLTVNGGDEAIELSNGGFLAFGSPTPNDGVTSLSIAYTGAGRVRVWLLG